MVQTQFSQFLGYCFKIVWDSLTRMLASGIASSNGSPPSSSGPATPVCVTRRPHHNVTFHFVLFCVCCAHASCIRTRTPNLPQPKTCPCKLVDLVRKHRHSQTLTLSPHFPTRGRPDLKRQGENTPQITVVVCVPGLSKHSRLRACALRNF